MALQTDMAVERAKAFKALGDPTRVRILDFLSQRCGVVAVDEQGDVHPVQGPSFGEVCCHITGTEKITTTISFHLNVLKDAGLITVEKRGRLMLCDVNRPAIANLAEFLIHKATDPSGCDEECR